MRTRVILLLFTFCIQAVPQTVAQELLSESGALVVPVPLPAEVPPQTDTGAVIQPMPLEPVESALSVRINEVMWMGSDLSTSDEWVELTAVPAMTGSVVTQSLPLDGWTLIAVKDGGVETVLAHFGPQHHITSGSYLIVANYPAAQSRLRAEPALVTTAMSLPNTKLQLRLRNNAGLLIDEVDDGIGAPFAGANPSGGTKASMERIGARLPGTVATSWQTAPTMRGWDSAAAVRGTPGFPNATVESPDVSPPADAQDVRAFVWSGSLLAAWQRSTSPDLAHQLLVIQNEYGDETAVIELGADAHTYTAPVPAAHTLVLRSVDETGLASTGVHISVQPLYKPILNEVLPDPDGADTAEWIELFNPYDVPLDLRGWVLQSGTKSFVLTQSGSLLMPGQFRRFTQAETALVLPNSGGEVRLVFVGHTIERLAYPALAEGVSYGRLETGVALAPLCMPQPDARNVAAPVPVAVEGLEAGLTTFNLSLRALSGATLAGATCQWDFGDGYVYAGCNPPAHAMKLGGQRTISVMVRDYCSNTMLHTWSVFVPEKAQSSSKSSAGNMCTPEPGGQMIIHEVLPAPPTSEDEWVELHNAGSGAVSLCGWSLDDGEGGSKPYTLGTGVVELGGYLFIPSSVSRLAFNNDHDVVRLIAPLAGGGTGVLMSVPYHAAPHNRAYALRPDGQWLWTPYATPGAENQFKEIASTDDLQPTVVLHAALPDAMGIDAGSEWIELKNLTARPQWLNGWSIETASGKVLSLQGTVLSKNTVLRIALKPSFTLGNARDALKLLDPAGQIRSVLAWRKPAAGQVIRRYEGVEPLTPERVSVVDPLHLRATFVFNEEHQPITLHAQLAGIVVPKSSEEIIVKNTVSALIKDKKIELQSDSHGSVFYAYAGQVELAPLLLGMGHAYVAADAPFDRFLEYLVYEQEARVNKRGLWSTPASAAAIDTLRLDQQLDAVALREGVQLRVQPAGGLVSSGQVITASTNVPADLYVAHGTGSFSAFSGSLRPAQGGEVRFMAEYHMKTGTGRVLRSSVVTHEYAVLQDRYEPCLRITEVYPSPGSGGGEWVEVENICTHSINMIGWGIDDVEGAGSKKQTFMQNVRVEPKGLLLLSGSLLAISLNNGGDTVSLYMPNNRVSSSIAYPSVKKGRSYALAAERFCLTDAVTPGGSNLCMLNVPVRKTPAKSSTAGILGLKTAFEFMLFEPTLLSTKVDLGFTLYEGLNDRNIQTIKYLYVTIILLSIGPGLCFLVYRIMVRIGYIHICKK